MPTQDPRSGGNPKIRVYMRVSPKQRASFWKYAASTTQAGSREEAAQMFAPHAPRGAEIRTEFAATHGYYVED